MNERDLEKLSKAEFIKMIEKLQKKAKKPKIVIVDDDYGQVPPPRTYKLVPAPRTNETIEKPVPKLTNGAKQMAKKAYEDLIVLPPPTQQPMAGRKPIRRQPQRPPPPQR